MIHAMDHRGIPQPCLKSRRVFAHVMQQPREFPLCLQIQWSGELPGAIGDATQVIFQQLPMRLVWVGFSIRPVGSVPVIDHGWPSVGDGLGWCCSPSGAVSSER